jgi:hypothetical protein
MTPHVTPVDQWLADATRGLSAESAARVRAEIQQHYDLAHEDSARESGGDAADVMRALGDPRTANHAYRKVLLTEQEAMMAPALTQRKRPTLRNILLGSALLAPVVWAEAGKHHDPGFWPLMIAIFCTLPLAWFLPPTTLERSRIHVYVSGVRVILVVGVFCWYHGWIGALSIGSVIVSFEYFFTYRRMSIFCKLAAGQTYSLLPEEPQLTHLEAMHLRTLCKGGGTAENVTVTLLFVMLTGMTVWQPATFAPMAIWTGAGYVTRRTLPIYTEARSRWLRIARWATMAAAAVLPPLYGARKPWLGAILLAWFFMLLDTPGISLRRKLPIAEWPKRLYW